MAAQLPREQHGHTLLELLAVLGITIVLAAAALPAGSGGLDWRLGWLVFVDRNGNLVYDAGDELLLRQGPLAAGIEVRFGFTSGAKPLYIAYNGAGRSCSASNALAARWGTLSLILGNQARHIKINMLGRVRVCDPQRDTVNCSGVGED